MGEAEVLPVLMIVASVEKDKQLALVARIFLLPPLLEQLSACGRSVLAQ